MACGILVPQPGIELVPPALEVQSLSQGSPSFVLYFRFQTKWYHTAFVFSFWLTSLSMIISRSIHVAANGIVSSFFMVNIYCVCMCVCIYIYIYIYYIFFIHSSIDEHQVVSKLRLSLNLIRTRKIVVIYEEAKKELSIKQLLKIKNTALKYIKCREHLIEKDS